MFSVPQLPTDNLYKFIAVSGVVLFLAGIIAPQFVAQDDEEKTYGIWKEHFPIVLERSSASVKATRDAEQQVQKGEVVNLSTVLEALDRARVELATFQNTLRVRRTIKERQFLVLSFVAWIGAITAIGGFFLWWFKVQRHQDAVLFEELRQARMKTIADTQASAQTQPADPQTSATPQNHGVPNVKAPATQA